MLYLLYSKYNISLSHSATLIFYTKQNFFFFFFVNSASKINTPKRVQRKTSSVIISARSYCNVVVLTRADGGWSPSGACGAAVGASRLACRRLVTSRGGSAAAHASRVSRGGTRRCRTRAHWQVTIEPYTKPWPWVTSLTLLPNTLESSFTSYLVIYSLYTLMPKSRRIISCYNCPESFHTV